VWIVILLIHLIIPAIRASQHYIVPTVWA